MPEFIKRPFKLNGLIWLHFSSIFCVLNGLNVQLNGVFTCPAPLSKKTCATCAPAFVDSGDQERGIEMAFIYPGLEIVVASGDVFSGLTVGNAGEFAAEIIVESGGTVIDTGISTSGYLGLDPGAVAIGVVNSGG